MKSKEILPDITRRTIVIILERDGFLGKMTIGDILNALLAAEEEIEQKQKEIQKHLIVYLSQCDEIDRLHRMLGNE